MIKKTKFLKYIFIIVMLERSERILLGKDFTKNEEYLAAPLKKVWNFISTTEGWKAFLCDIASNSNGKKRIYLGDQIELVLGELSISSTCVGFKENRLICFYEKYKALFPNGENWFYNLTTSFELSPINEHTTKIIVISRGYESNEMMQWVKECSEMGWRQTLYNLKSVIELGLDLRNEIFNYPRLGVFNYTANLNQLAQNNMVHSKGNFLSKVYNNGPAYNAGLRDGDIITHINGYKVPTYYDFVRVLSKHYLKKKNLSIKYIRDGQQFLTNTTLTYNDRFTGMIDPLTKPLEKVASERKNNDK
ncbi:PDZ domain-containing protein [Bacillus sp. 166amftsu]|uniref:PDZ domain-containing protein n=1 Tax=Bacillus sp. 166amftsu TaxID=1761753 RepID=UPI00089CB24A|nr:PDZ domain-containing protein [Bacillus sp. 166amftsu]SDZ40619.1 PDZ domain-containing protein [Bacillus sp. 166amftsu]